MHHLSLIKVPHWEHSESKLFDFLERTCDENNWWSIAHEIYVDKGRVIQVKTTKDPYTRFVQDEEVVKNLIEIKKIEREIFEYNACNEITYHYNALDIKNKEVWNILSDIYALNIFSLVLTLDRKNRKFAEESFRLAKNTGYVAIDLGNANLNQDLGLHYSFRMFLLLTDFYTLKKLDDIPYVLYFIDMHT